MPDPFQISLKYEGKDVNDGSMDIADVVNALQGFSSAYGKIALRHDPAGQHRIRVADINKSSFAVLILASVAESHAGILPATTAAVSWVISTIVKLIDLKKALKGSKDPTVTVNGNGNLTIAAGGNVTLEMSKEVYELYASKAIDSDLAKIVSPLHKGKIDRATLAATGDAGFSQVTEVSAEAKDFFQPNDESATFTSRSTTLTGTMVSLNKETNRGMFRMKNGTSVEYRLVGDDPTLMYNAFSHKGLVRAECVAMFNDDLEVRSIEIASVIPLQVPFDFPLGTSGTSERFLSNDPQ